MIVLKILFIYSLFAVLVYFLLAILINVNKGINAEDDAARMMALLFASTAWPITIILIIYNNIKGDLKDGKNN